MKRKDAPQMRPSTISIAKFRSDILSRSLKITHSVNGKMKSSHCAVTHGHLATESGRHYAPLSFVVIYCNDIMTAVRPNDGRSPSDNEAHKREV